MTRVLIVADMEGIGGIASLEECTPGHPAYETGTALLTGEVNALADAAFAAGARAVSVIDWHAGGGNIRRDQLDSRVQVVAEDLTTGYDVMVLCGFHAMAGTRQAFLSHTMTRGLVLEIDGAPAGELTLLSRWAGEAGIPIALVTGDRAASLESETWLPETPTVTVKSARSWDRADPLPVERVREALRAEVARVLERPDRWRSYRPETPIRFRLRLRAAYSLAARLPWLEPGEDGWLAGSVPTTKALIDLIDVLSALMEAERRADMLRRLREDPAVAALLREEQMASLARARRKNPWP